MSKHEQQLRLHHSKMKISLGFFVTFPDCWAFKPSPAAEVRSPSCQQGLPGAEPKLSGIRESKRHQKDPFKMVVIAVCCHEKNTQTMCVHLLSLQLLRKLITQCRICFVVFILCFSLNGRPDWSRFEYPTATAAPSSAASACWPRS